MPDAFHVLRLSSAAVDDVRRRRQQQRLGRHGHRDDPLYRARRLLRRDVTTLTERQWTRLEHALFQGDRSGQVTNACMVGQELRLLYRRSHDLPEAGTGSGRSWTAAAAPRSPSCCAWHAP